MPLALRLWPALKCFSSPGLSRAPDVQLHLPLDISIRKLTVQSKPNMSHTALTSCSPSPSSPTSSASPSPPLSKGFATSQLLRPNKLGVLSDSFAQPLPYVYLPFPVDATFELSQKSIQVTLPHYHRSIHSNPRCHPPLVPGGQPLPPRRSPGLPILSSSGSSSTSSLTDHLNVPM